MSRFLSELIGGRPCCTPGAARLAWVFAGLVVVDEVLLYAVEQ